ncbi:MAG: Nramp family divalent metal transporter, partial [Verrucomicrobiae bacterium]|nr:Nramp family divalent metal transporter [Verrucomicrobiae bacterium]
MNRFLEFLRSIGPAIIVAAVVCGPGSMLMSSKTGAIYGYQMIWVLVLAAILMWSMVVLSARLGVVHEHTLLQELANRLGRPVAALVGIFLFLVVAGFQVSNNVAILAAIEPFLEKEGSTAPALEGRVALQIGILVFLNVFVIAVIYRFGNLYKPVEKLLKGIVLLVVVCFAINLFLAKPDLGAALRGLIPSPPEGGYGAFFSSPTGNANVTILQALIATTFSVAGAFFQSYSVRAKGWGLADAKKGMIDSLVGIMVLGGVSLILMTTAAAALHQESVDASKLNSVSDIARQFEPLFGHNAKLVFGVGIFAGGFGAFMVNALIGGNMLADGFGKGATMNDRGTKHATVIALLLGMGIAVTCIVKGIKPVAAITVA